MRTYHQKKRVKVATDDANIQGGAEERRWGEEIRCSGGPERDSGEKTVPGRRRVWKGGVPNQGKKKKSPLGVIREALGVLERRRKPPPKNQEKGP